MEGNLGKENKRTYPHLHYTGRGRKNIRIKKKHIDMENASSFLSDVTLFAPNSL